MGVQLLALRDTISPHLQSGEIVNYQSDFLGKDMQRRGELKCKALIICFVCKETVKDAVGTNNVQSLRIILLVFDLTLVRTTAYKYSHNTSSHQWNGYISRHMLKSDFPGKTTITYTRLVQQ